MRPCAPSRSTPRSRTPSARPAPCASAGAVRSSPSPSVSPGPLPPRVDSRRSWDLALPPRSCCPRCCPSSPRATGSCARSPWTPSRPSEIPPPRPCSRKPSPRNSRPCRPCVRTGSPRNSRRSTGPGSIPTRQRSMRRTSNCARRRSGTSISCPASRRSTWPRRATSDAPWRTRGPGPAPPAELFDDLDPARLEPLAGLLRAIGSLKAPEAMDVLKGFAGDSSVTLRTAALVGLARLGPEGVSVASAGMFETDRDLLKELARALAEQGEAGQSALVQLLPQISGEKLVLLDALARTAVPASAVPVLRDVVTEGGPESVLAATMLGRLKAKEAGPPLVKALEDPNSLGRRELLTALGETNDGSASEVVSRDLYHDLPEIRAAAASALARMGTRTADASEALDALKGDYYRRVREAAATALSKPATAAEGSH